MIPLDETLQAHLRATTSLNWLSRTEPSSRTMTFECLHHLKEEHESVIVRLVVHPFRPNAFRIEFPGGRRERYLAQKHDLRDLYEETLTQVLSTFPAFVESASS